MIKWFLAQLQEIPPEEERKPNCWLGFEQCHIAVLFQSFRSGIMLFIFSGKISREGNWTWLLFKYRDISEFINTCFENFGLLNLRKGTHEFRKWASSSKTKFVLKVWFLQLARNFVSCSMNFDYFLYAFVLVLSIILGSNMISSAFV